MSRLYLAITKNAATVVSVLIAATILLGAVILVSEKNVARRLTAALSGIAFASIVAAGVIGYASGEREIEAHEEETAEVEIEAEGIAFDTALLQIPEGRVELSFANRDPSGTFHDIGIYSAPPLGTPDADFVAGKPFVAVIAIDGGTEGSAVIDTHAVGLKPNQSYQFRCDFHPGMKGVVEVVPSEDYEGSKKSEKGEQKE